MKKLRKSIAAVLCAAMCMPLAACGGGGNGGEGKPTLSAPVLTLNDNFVYWNIIDSADSYGVYIQDEHITDITSVRYSLANLAPGSYKVEVTAKYGDKESKKSNSVTYVKEQAQQEAPSYVYSEPENGEYDYSGILKNVTDIALTRQLYDEKLWSTFVDQFRTKSDIDGGFRGEFWGKHMIGACLIYEQTHDEKLYAILENTTRDMLTTQGADGCISSYGKLSENEREFSDWDVWCRKYVFMGMEYFHDICKDEQLKAELVQSMLDQLDYIMEYVGDGDEQLNINDTGINFKGLASSSILEAIVKLYTLSGEKRVLDFATYIVDNGGTAITDLVERAVENKLLPYQWGAPKGYEHTSFFEGVLDYYMVTGDARCRKAVINYSYAFLDSEVVVTGGAGYNSEQFNHASVEQANPENDEANLETCVTVTVLRYLYKSYLLTGDTVFLDAFEKTFYNQMVGAVDTENNFPHPFSSYFNLMFSPKFSASGGGISIDGDYIHAYGCCIAFGATGIGMVHKAAQTVNDNGFNVNLYLNGTVTAASPSGNAVSLTTQTNYPTSGTVKITVGASKSETYAINLRIPAWSGTTKVSVNGKSVSGATAGKYFMLEREWKNGDEIVVTFDMSATLFYGSKECSNPNAQYNVAVLRGPIVLARDVRLGEDIFQTVDIATDENGCVILEPSATASFSTICEYKVKLKDGSYIHMVDYASAGKTYNENSLFTVFMPTTDYWKLDLDTEGGIALVNASGLYVAVFDDNKFTAGDQYYNYADLNPYKIVFTDRGDGYYSLSYGGHDTVLTVNSDSTITEQPYTGADNQLFFIKKCGLYNFKLVSKADGRLISGRGPDGIVWMYTEVDSNVQHWKFIKI